MQPTPFYQQKHTTRHHLPDPTWERHWWGWREPSGQLWPKDWVTAIVLLLVLAIVACLLRDEPAALGEGVVEVF